MKLCPLCSERPAKRFCPAKGERICAVCCGTKREVEIYCPEDCSYLRSGRNYESHKHFVPPEVSQALQRFNHDFIRRYTEILNEAAVAVIEERRQSEWLVDIDVIEVYKALLATMRTLSSGIYYETMPEGSIRQSLFNRLKALFDRHMEPPEGVDYPALKVSEAIDVLEFLTVSGQFYTNPRPKARQYLDWLRSIVPAASNVQDFSPSGLILP